MTERKSTDEMTLNQYQCLALERQSIRNRLYILPRE